MTDLIANYIAVDMICVAALIVLVYVVWSNVLFIPKMKRLFVLAALITMTVIASELGSVIFEHIIVVHRVPANITNSIGFSLSPFIALVLSEAFLVDKGKIRSLLTIPVWINFVFVLSSPWTGLVFKINEDASYLRGPLFGIYVIAYLCSYIILIMVSVKSMKHYQYHSKSAFVILLIFTTIGTSVQMLMPQVLVSWLCGTLSLILFYAFFCMLTQTQDTLTGLLNRNVYDRYTNHLDHDAAGMVLFFDLDNFKQINDQYGHQWGDFCLQRIGSLIKASFYKLGLCFRIGGDEFCVICNKDKAKVLDALIQFHRRIDEIRKSKNLQGELPMVSTGHANFHGLARDYDAAVKKADEEMYYFKNSRKQNTAINEQVNHVEMKM